MKSYTYKPTDVKGYPQKWWHVDAANQVLGRVASEVAKILRGKNKPTYTTYADMGDFVVVTNTSKILVTGNKLTQKTYHFYTGYIGNMKHLTYEELIKKNPVRCFEIAVKGMLGKNPLGRDQFRRLKAFAGPEHTHQAQQPQLFVLPNKPN